MAQSGYTPIIIYGSVTSGNTPLASNLTTSATGVELAINAYDGKLFYKDASGNVQVLASKAGNINVSSLSFGTTGLTPSTATTGAITVAGTLITSNGGTGLSSYTAGDLPYYATGTALSKLGIGTSGYILSSSGTAPQWVNSISIGSGTFTSVTDSGLTAGRVNYNGTGGLLVDSANLTFDGTTLTANKVTSTNDASISGLTVGKGAGSQSDNTALGTSALIVNTTGNRNTALGLQALYSNTTGSDNTAVGRNALVLSTGSSNTSVGADALHSNTTASYNTAVGYQAGYSTTTNANPITAVGGNALYSNTTGSDNTAVGYNSLYTNTTGQQNTASGRASMYSNTTGGNSSAYGYISLYSNTTGNYNTALGHSALYSNTTASNNTAVGYQAGYSNTTGANSVYVGQGSGYSHTGGDSIYIGKNSGYAQTTGNNNTVVGGAAMYGTGTTSGSNNSAFGLQALNSNSTGNYNTAVGMQSLTSNTTGAYNVAVGYQALYTLNRTADVNSANTALGYQAGYPITTGPANTCLGYGTGTSLTTGSNNVYIGINTTASSGSVSNEIVISGTSGTTGKGSNTGFISPNGGGVYQGNNSTVWSITSDARLKKNIVDNNVGLDKINQIKVRNFEYRLPEEITDLDKSNAVNITGIQLGAIAQELIEVLPDCVKTESTGVMSVDASNITWHLINAVKELSAQVTDLQAKLKSAGVAGF